MFDERGADGEFELRPYRQTAWSRIERGNAEPANTVSAETTESPAASAGGNSFVKSLAGVIQPIRAFVSRNEELLLLAVILLLLCDCDDDLELLIVIVLLLYPKLSDLFR